MTLELFAHPIGEEAPRRDRLECAGRVGECVTGVRVQLDFGGGDVELELLNTGRSRNGDHARQTDQSGQRHLCRLGVDFPCDGAQRLQQRLDSAQVLSAEQ